jgi:1-acyl-sn-glycerol-3-phosphate acyltransferase
MNVKDYGAVPAVSNENKRNETLIQSIMHTMQGILSILLLSVNTLICFTLLMAVATLKFILPINPWRKLCSMVLNVIAVSWISVNNFNIWLTKRIKWDVRGLEGLSVKDWYLVISNHQTWVDIVVLQNVFNRRIPFLKFFLKKELIWVPLLGIAWWALDFPFMKRYSASFLKKHPNLKGKDIEITRKACQKFKTIPVSVMNFVEGTRFTKEKHDRQKSPFQYLLKPKAGGIGFVLSTMGEQMSCILNVTIMYPGGDKSFWSFLCGRILDIRVVVEKIPITEELLGDYVEDRNFQAKFQVWLNDIWTKKDKMLRSLLDK